MFAGAVIEDIVRRDRGGQGARSQGESSVRRSRSRAKAGGGAGTLLFVFLLLASLGGSRDAQALLLLALIVGTAALVLLWALNRDSARDAVHLSVTESVEETAGAEDPLDPTHRLLALPKGDLTISMMYGAPPEPRTVTIKRVSARDDGLIYLECYCHLRRAPRTFRADRIDYFFDGAGQIIETRQFLEHGLGIPLWTRAIRARKK